MSRMSELHIQVQELLAEGWTPSMIAANLRIPLEWVQSVEDDFYSYPTIDDFADADAHHYGLH